MSSYYPLDHATYWDGDPLMESLTRKYQQKAMEMVNGGMFKPGTRHPWTTESGPRSNSRIQIFEFVGDHCGIEVQPEFTSTRDLYMYFDKSPEDGNAQKTNRRLIILEDMDPRFVELLGVKLDIPPAFFLAHCDEFANLSVVLEGPFPQTRCFPEEALGRFGRFAIETGNTDHWWLDLTEDIKFVNYRSHVSYWGHKYGEDSWTAVLLVDPPFTRLRPDGHNSFDCEHVIRLEDYKPGRNLFAQIMVDPLKENLTQPYETCIYDFLVEAHGNFAVMHTSDPFSATNFTRNFIRSAWEEWIWRSDIDLHDTMMDDQEQHRFSRGTRSLEALAGQDNKTVQGYQKLISERWTIRYDKKCLKSIIWAFRCEDSEYRRQVHEWKTTQETNDGKIQTTETASDLEQENGLWKFLEEKLEMMETSISRHMEGYSQRAAMEEAFAANMQAYESNRQTEVASRQARSSGQLTKIATVVVPCTFVASIFSMGGDFAAGMSLFYIYWAISIPATLALLAWVLQTDILEYWQKFRGWVRQRRGPTTDQGVGWRRLIRRGQHGSGSDEEKAEAS